MTTPGFSSGTYTWGAPGGPPMLVQLVIEAYQRCGKTGITLTSELLQSARMSMNLVLSSWANRGINLWTVTLFEQYMPQGVRKYVFPPSIVDIIPDSVVLRQYQMGAPVAVAPAFSTTSGSSTVTVGNLPQTPSAGQYIAVGVMTSIGGIVLDSFYKVVSVPGTNQATITAASAATSTATGGFVPQFVTTLNSNTVTVNFPNHGLLAGQTFNVEVQTSVGGLALVGPYAVASVATANQFTITSTYPAGFAASVYENNGDTNLATQSTTIGLTQNGTNTDILLYPMSRGEYMALSQKEQQGRPTSVWINRQISPEVNVWQVPDANGPYELRFQASCQVQDADIIGGQSLGVPFRMLEAFTADLAAHLAMKWALERLAALKQYAAEQWAEASDEDREHVTTYIGGDMSSYFN